MSKGKAGPGKKQCPSCKAFVGVRAQKCPECESVFPAAKPKSKSSGVFSDTHKEDLYNYILKTGGIAKVRKQIEDMQANKLTELAINYGGAEKLSAALSEIEIAIG